MKNNEAEILAEVSRYYTSKLTQHGITPRGVDWNGEESQLLRFEQLCKIIDNSKQFSVNDLGCGYGALYDFLSRKYKRIRYLGIDVSESMIRASERRFQDKTQVRFIHSATPDQVADYSVASGIFNVRLNRSDEEWWDYLESNLNVLDSNSRIGFAFNCLTTYSDAEKKQNGLYYADPCALFDLCKRRYSRNVALLHDYGLYEFTILIRKQI